MTNIKSLAEKYAAKFWNTQHAADSFETGFRAALQSPEVVAMLNFAGHSVICAHFDHGQPCDCGYEQVLAAFDALKGSK